VVPDTVHSGVPAFCGAAVGHALAAGAASVVEDAITSGTEGVIGEDVVVDEPLAAGAPASEPHAARVMTSDAAQAANATAEDAREEFTVVTLQPGYPAADTQNSRRVSRNVDFV
jgi:hypothetical protein